MLCEHAREKVSVLNIWKWYVKMAFSVFVLVFDAITDGLVYIFKMLTTS